MQLWMNEGENMKKNLLLEDLVCCAKDFAGIATFIPYAVSLFGSAASGIVEGYSTAKGAPACNLTLALGAVSSAFLLSFLSVADQEMLQKSYGDERLDYKKVGAAVGSSAAIPAIAYGAGFVLGKLM